MSDNRFDTAAEESYWLEDTLDPISPDYLDRLEKDMFLWVPGMPTLFNDKVILDLGAGKAPVGTLIAQRLKPHLIISLELIYRRLQVGRIWAQRLDRFALVCGDAFKLPFRSGTIDYVIANSVLHHLPDIIQVASEVSRVLKPGGYYLGREPNFNNPLVRWAVFTFPGTPIFRGTHSPNEYPLRAQRIEDAFIQSGCRCNFQYFWRRLPKLNHPLLSVAISVRAQRM